MNSWIDFVNFAAASGGFVVTLLGLIFNLSIPFIDKRTRRFFTALFALLIAYVTSDLLSQAGLGILGTGYLWLSRAAVFCESLFSSMLMPLIAAYLMRCAGEKSRKNAVNIAEGVLWLAYLILLVVTQFTEQIYYFTPNNVYHRGPWYPVLMVPPVLMMLLNLTALYRRRGALTKQQRQAFACYLLIPFVCMLIQMAAYGLLMVMIGTCAAALAMFIFILQEQMERFIRQQEEITRQQMEIANQRANVTVLQMRPHFIYNTLMTIYSLCNLDPQKARQVTLDFTNYLRKNFNAVASDGMVPFSEEWEHTRAYLSVEQAQHEDMLLVDCDMPFTQFRLPPLTLQPIVENAVKYGIDPYAGPLHVAIRTRRTGSGAEITVEDSGPGFDPSDDSKPHAALKNIRQRLEMMCRGSITIQPRDGGGTAVTITIPDAQIPSE